MTDLTQNQTTSSHTSIYLDQNVFGHLLDSGNWKSHPIGQVLEENRDKLNVWVSPTHVIELSQTTDHSRRAKLAQLMLELCDARRMWCGYDFFLVESFGNFLNNYIPGAFNPEPFLNFYKNNAAQLWTGHLALLAAVENLHLGPGAKSVQRSKRESHLLHCRIGADPKVQINQIINAAQQQAITVNHDPMGFKNLTDDEIEKEIAICKEKATSVPRSDIKNALAQIRKHRKEVSRVYGAIDIGGALHSVFKFPRDLEETFNAEHLVNGWPSLVANCDIKPLPKTVTSNPSKEIISILNASIEAVANKGLATASIGYHALIRELEVCINNNDFPTAGAAMDVDHAIAALKFSIFVSHDQKLLANVQSFLNSCGINDHHAVSDAKQIKKLLFSNAR